MDRLALILLIIGGLTGAVSAIRFDVIAAIFGGQVSS